MSRASVLLFCVFTLGAAPSPKVSSGEPPLIRTLKTHIVFANRFIQVENNEVTLPSGGAGHHIRLLVGGKSQAGSVAIVENGQRQVLLLRLFRYGVNGWQWELPRGGAEGHETYVDVALRELHEETGISKDAVKEVKLLGTIQPDSSLIASEVGVVWIRLSREHRIDHQRGEAIVSHRWADPDELLGEILAGELSDGFTLSALTYLHAHRKSTKSLE